MSIDKYIDVDNEAALFSEEIGTFLVRQAFLRNASSDLPLQS
jgi:hypothetical protein